MPKKNFFLSEDDIMEHRNDGSVTLIDADQRRFYLAPDLVQTIAKAAANDDQFAITHTERVVFFAALGIIACLLIGYAGGWFR